MGKIANRRGSAGSAANRTLADAFAEKMRPAFLAVMGSYSRYPNNQEVATELNVKGVPSATGRKWHPETVRRLIIRLGPSFEVEVRAARQGGFAKELAEIEQIGK
jgi:hypothetical protein